MLGDRTPFLTVKECVSDRTFAVAGGGEASTSGGGGAGLPGPEQAGLPGNTGALAPGWPFIPESTGQRDAEQGVAGEGGHPNAEAEGGSSNEEENFASTLDMEAIKVSGYFISFHALVYTQHETIVFKR